MILRLLACLVCFCAPLGAQAQSLFGGRLPEGVVKSVEGPEIVVRDASWRTQIFGMETDHDAYAIWLHAFPPADHDFSDMTSPSDIFDDICAQVLRHKDAFSVYGADWDQLEHIDINIKSGGQTALPYDISVNVVDETCAQGYYFNRVLQDAEIASRHSRQDHVRANMLAWGIARTEIKFMRSNTGRRIELSFELSPQFGRSLQTVDAHQLCILTMLQLDQRETVLGIPVNPRAYDQMVMKFGKERSFGILRYERWTGSADVDLDNGRCVSAAEVEL